MKIAISKLTTADFDAVDALMKRNSGTLGFLTREALLEGFIKKGGALGAKADNGQLVGYLLFYKDNPKYFRIVQLCVLEDCREQGIAKRLVEALKESVTTQKIVRLSCRRNFPANGIWPQLGFVAIGEKQGRSKEGHPLTLWCLTLALDEQLELFQERTSDETLDVIIDAQIFFHFDKPDNAETKPSKALLSDFLVDSLNLWITPELFNEIDRNDDPDQREKSRDRARRFLQINPEPRSVVNFEKILGQIFSTKRPSQESDVKQLAMAAASNVKIFITRDQALLRKAKKITTLTGLQVLSPAQLIIQIHELSERQSYTPERIAGLDLWQRMTSNDLASFPYNSFLNLQERKGQFREKLEPFLVNPNRYECQLLQSGEEEEMIAIRVLSRDSSKILTAPLVRLAHSANQLRFGRFLIADTISRAISENMDMVKFNSLNLTPSLVTDLLEMGFTECKDSFVRFCFSRCLERTEVLSAIDKLCPESIDNYHNMSDYDLERHCSPLSLVVNQKHFLIPIVPSYAISLVDRKQSSGDLFGGKTSVLIRWDHVYYRAKNRHKMLAPPARILWYVSGNQKQIVAISHLDEVETGAPKNLFNKFKKSGILNWDKIYKMCDGDVSKEIMALKFSHTFPLRKPILLKKIKTVFAEDGVGLWIQSPSEIPVEIFQKLFQLGYPDKS